MKHFLFLILYILLFSCQEKTNDEVPNKLPIKVVDTIRDLHKTPKVVLNKLDRICSQLNLQRLSENLPHWPDSIISLYRITYLPGCCFCPLSDQGVCFTFYRGTSASGASNKDTIVLGARHFQYSYFDGKINVDTVFHSSIKKISNEQFYQLEQLIRGSYLDDHVEFAESSNSAPDYFFIERFYNDYDFGKPTVQYKLNVKQIIRENSSFNEIINYSMSLAKIKWKTWKGKVKISHPHKNTNMNGSNIFGLDTIINNKLHVTIKKADETGDTAACQIRGRIKFGKQNVASKDLKLTLETECINNRKTYKSNYNINILSNGNTIPFWIGSYPVCKFQLITNKKEVFHFETKLAIARYNLLIEFIE